jgi:hypothetical protein
MRYLIALITLFGHLGFAMALHGQATQAPGMSLGDLPAPLNRPAQSNVAPPAPNWSGAPQINTPGMPGNFSLDMQMVPMPPQNAFRPIPPGQFEPMLNVESTSQQCSANNCYFDEPMRCDSCCSRDGFYAGGAVVFAKPHFKEAFQISETNTQTGTQTLHPFSYDYSASPRVWFGIRRDCVGLRATYWEYDQEGDASFNTATPTTIFGAHVVSVIFPANIFARVPGQTLSARDALETQVINLHGTFDGSFDGICYSGGVGLRYAKLVQTFEAFASAPPVFDAAIAQSSLAWERVFNGIGPSVSFDMRKRVGCGPWSFVANGGGALLYGEKSLHRTVFGDQSPQPAAPFLNLDKADEVVGIGELGFGVEWLGYTGTGNEVRFRGTYEGQLWAEAGAPTLGFLGFQGFAVQAEFRR